MTNKLLYGLHVNQASNTKTSEKNVMAHGDTLHAERYLMEKDLQDSVNEMLYILRKH